MNYYYTANCVVPDGYNSDCGDVVRDGFEYMVIFAN